MISMTLSYYKNKPTQFLIKREERERKIKNKEKKSWKHSEVFKLAMKVQQAQFSM
jgi:hypothetical protein